MLKYCLILLHIAFLNVYPQILTEIMFSPSATDAEFIEVFNTSNRIISLENYKLKYHNSSADILISPVSDYNLLPHQFAVIFEGDYDPDSGIYKDIIHPNNIFFIDNNAFGRSGMSNSSGRKIILINAEEDTVDFYTYSADNKPGYSDERIDYSSNNWKNSLNLNGTPGHKNSVSPRNYDVGITGLKPVESYAVLGDTVSLKILIKNKGAENAEEFSLNISVEAEEERSFYHETIGFLKTKDSLERSISLSDIAEGENLITADISFSKDENNSNDTAYAIVNGVKVDEFRGDLVVNEIMHSPDDQEPEWIELFNNKEKGINLLNYLIADKSDTVSLSGENTIIDGKGYLIVADDSSFLSFYRDTENYIIKNMPSLNNSGDDIIIMDHFERIIDSVAYSSDWGGKNGNSIERIDPLGISEDPENWQESLSPTPGKINSVSKKENDIKIDTVNTDPIFPLIGSKVFIKVKISNCGKNSFRFFMRLSEDIDLDNYEDILIEESNYFNIEADGDVIFQFITDIEVNNSERNFIIDLLPQDDYPSDNRYVFTILPAYPQKSIQINEVMYSPLNYEPEWFELYNNSQYSINIKNWEISDVITNPLTKTIEENITFRPKSYMVISKSESIFDFHGEIKGRVLLLPFANLNNDNDGIIIRDPYGRRIDSLYYFNDWGGSSGKSLERKKSDNSSLNKNNWGSSIDKEGSTPGRINSITPKKYDLSITELSSFPVFPLQGENVFIETEIHNTGSYDAGEFEIEYLVKKGKNNEPLGTIKNLFLASGDSLFSRSENSISITDTLVISALITFAPDEDKINNYYEKHIIAGFNKSSMLINEIMFKPNSGEPEWVEIFNNSDSAIDLRNWQIGDIKDKIIITGVSYWVNPGEYIIISDYSSSSFFNDGVKFIEADIPNLNNRKDAVVLYDFRDALIDSTYYDAWSDIENSTSLERISLDRASDDSSNWSFSLDPLKSTPGKANSVSLIPRSAYGDIIINEIMFDPAEENCEFIEFFNTADHAIELGGWKLMLDGGKYFVIMNRSFILGSGSYFVAASDSSILNNYPWLEKENSLRILNSGSLNLTNTGKMLYLKNIAGDKIDSVFYSGSWHNSSFLETKNISLELINRRLSGNSKSNWSSSVSHYGATPGRQNSINVDNLISNAQLQITPNPFSPDNDGFEDYTLINYSLSEPISQIRIRIFDSKGRHVRTIANNQSAGSKGTILFDGLDKNKLPLKMGIYIILFEAVYHRSSNIESIKDVIVVARKL